MSEERHEIEVRLKDGWSIYRIAKHLGKSYNTVKNEIKRGTVSLYHGKVERYKADEICFFADFTNGLPRKIIGYATPEELFDRHLDRIYAA